MDDGKQNIFSELTDSIKAKLYDFHYSPFMSSFVVSWIMLNHKYLLILISDETIKLKLELLNQYMFGINIKDYYIFYVNGFYIPLLMALFYVFIYPNLAKLFYEITLNYQLNMREIKQKIEKTTLITQEEKDVLIQEMANIKDNYFKSRESYITLEQKYKKARSVENQNIEKMSSELKKNIEEKVRYINQLEEKIKSLIEENTNLKNQNEQQISKNNEDDKTKILKYLYEANYNGNLYRSELITNMVNTINLARPIVEVFVKELYDENIISDNQNNRVKITEKGQQQLLDLFYRKNL